MSEVHHQQCSELRRVFFDISGVDYDYDDYGGMYVKVPSSQHLLDAAAAAAPGCDLSTLRVEWAVPSTPTRVRFSVEVRA